MSKCFSRNCAPFVADSSAMGDRVLSDQVKGHRMINEEQCSTGTDPRVVGIIVTQATHFPLNRSIQMALLVLLLSIRYSIRKVEIRVRSVRTALSPVNHIIQGILAIPFRHLYKRFDQTSPIKFDTSYVVNKNKKASGPGTLAVPGI